MKRLLMVLAFASAILIPPAPHAQAQPDLGANPPGANSDEGAGMAETDPLAPFNTRMFWFNRKLDDYFLHPVATGYGKVVPAPARRSVGRFIDNVSVLPRFANNLFQLRLKQAGTEVARFGINTTVGLVGLFDPADKWFGLEENHDDFGLTLGRYSVPTGPYLMLPFFGPSTIRDAIGRVADGAMNPITWLLPWYITYPTTGGEYLVDAINYRSLNPNLFEDVDRFAIDVYGAVQDGYTQRRAAAQKTVDTDSLLPKSQTP
ncbi:MAG: VacJ family lipoprotein [Candidatus Binatales bacterium]